MKSPKFNWNNEWLKRQQIDIDLGGETITLYEFPRSRFNKFVADSETLELTNEVEEEFDREDGKKGKRKVTQRKSFHETSEIVIEFVCATLSDATKGPNNSAPIKPAHWFKDLDLADAAYGTLVGLLYELNRFDAIAATGGNYMLLPTYMNLLDRMAQEQTPAQAD